MSTFEELVPAIQREAGSRPDLQAVRLVLDLSHPSSRRRAVSRPALLPARRRRPHPQPGGRAGHEHRPAGRLQSRPGSLRSSCRAAPTPALLDSYEQERIPVAQRLLETTDRAFQLVVSDGWLATLLRTKIIAKVAAIGDDVRGGPALALSARYRRSASAIRRARCRKRLPDCRRARRRRATASRGCGSGSTGSGTAEGPLSRARRHPLQPAGLRAGFVRCERDNEFGGLVRVHVIAPGVRE